MSTDTSHEEKALRLVREFFPLQKNVTTWTQPWFCSAMMRCTFCLLPASGKQENWFTYEGKEAVTKYQGQVLDRLKQIKMLEPRYSSAQMEAPCLRN